MHRFTSESGIPSCPRKNVTPAASKPGAGIQYWYRHATRAPSKALWVSAFAGTTQGNGPVDVNF